MSTLNVDKVDPSTGTALELGTSGDTVTVPSGVTLTTTNATLNLPTTITSTTEVKTNKISPATGVAFALGDSGDTFTVPSGATIVNSGTATGFGGGKVGQVIQGTNSTAVVGASGFFDSGLNAAITLTATSSKVLITVTDLIMMCQTSGDAGSAFRLERAISGGATTYPYLDGDDGGNYISGFYFQNMGTIAYAGVRQSYTFLDSPSTTSEITYTHEVNAYGTTMTVTSQWNDSPIQIILREILA